MSLRGSRRCALWYLRNGGHQFLLCNETFSEVVHLTAQQKKKAFSGSLHTSSSYGKTSSSTATFSFHSGWSWNWSIWWIIRTIFQDKRRWNRRKWITRLGRNWRRRPSTINAVGYSRHIFHRRLIKEAIETPNQSRNATHKPNLSGHELKYFRHSFSPTCSFDNRQSSMLPVSKPKRITKSQIMTLTLTQFSVAICSTQWWIQRADYFRRRSRTLAFSVLEHVTSRYCINNRVDLWKTK